MGDFSINSHKSSVITSPPETIKSPVDGLKTSLTAVLPNNRSYNVSTTSSLFFKAVMLKPRRVPQSISLIITS